ncbi:hypothetical protein SAMN02745248_01757 [Hathewaya proteolytica DSM 3090]|uniref:Uncharacterized protein n=2 Tax=Hathewaya proteolytica TaxID=29365 RepID=A0A1M6PLY5_9CLOT|nr:hypothetical protein SAMN02745248_01757 [Hathewaya proteolytica DSM 3090]
MGKKIASLILVATIFFNNMAVFAVATKPTEAELNKLYAEGYNAVKECKEKKTQQSVNSARATLSKFKGKLDWAIGEFSKEIDSVQHPILVSIVTGISSNKNKPVPESINKLRKEIKDLPVDFWRNSYSTALDEAQDVLIVKVMHSKQKYEMTKEESDREVLLKNINELSLIQDDNVKNFVEKIREEVKPRPTSLKKGTYIVGKDFPKGEYLFLSQGESYYKISRVEKGTTVTVAEGFIIGRKYLALNNDEVFEVDSVDMYHAKETPEIDIKKNKFIKGMYKVGKDIPAGEYLLVNKEEMYFQITSNSSGTLDSIYNNGFAMGQMYITLKKDQYIEVEACEIYEEKTAAKLDSTKKVIPPGMYKVGRDIAAGDYIFSCHGTKVNFRLYKDSQYTKDSLIKVSSSQDKMFFGLKSAQYIYLDGTVTYLK